MTKENDQKIFDTVYTHLLKQRKKSTVLHPNDPGRTMCAYRGDSGLRCAVGVLIADEHYSSKLENKTVNDIRVCQAIEKSGYVCDTYGLLESLQHVHDCWNAHQWREQLGEVAEKFSLTVPVLA